MSTLYQRYLAFVHSLLNSKKPCLSFLAGRMLKDEGSLTSQNVAVISEKSGIANILSLHPKEVTEEIVYCEVPNGEEWRSEFLKELLLLRKNELETDFVDLPQLSLAEIDDIIDWVATS